jgi:hypothetical protein
MSDNKYYVNYKAYGPLGRFETAALLLGSPGLT